MPASDRTVLLLLCLAVVTAFGCGSASDEATGASVSALTVCGADTVHGMDISHYDGTIDWTQAHASGIDFAIAKATEGTTFTDPAFATNWAAMRAAGVVRGAYHFFHANIDPVAQADFVVRTVGPLAPDDLPITLDLEVTDGESSSVVAANALQFLAAVTAATGRTAIVYTGPAYFNGLGNPVGFNDYSLWIANRGVSCPDVPAPWTEWMFWQHTVSGTVPGVGSGTVDLDTFNGTLAQLQSIGGDAGTQMDAGSPHNDVGHLDVGDDATDGATVESDAVVARTDAMAADIDAGASPSVITPSAGCGCRTAPRDAPSYAIVTWVAALMGCQKRRRPTPG